MTLNEPLLKALRSAEAEYGVRTEEWPKEVSEKLQELSERGLDTHASPEKRSAYLLELFERGFTASVVGDEMGYSRSWASARRPNHIRYTMNEEDEAELRRLLNRGISIKKIAVIMRRHVKWIQEMRRRL